ncbi:hypothetical protein AC792_10145 [Arthrobacter sp. RIT-PI-e]|uniref:tetratricopeptide repeat protein n=1 Tax=Arthrobacter sp. RIT-PI-e TaxID=1681197 RepID=UPI0006765D68|nr:tetratricopeptide repeat protein [Arthrobacter sp. RIT-PI-e]KNC18777.1 hypothetical protein AC792_10145 [Arthrobacter sp. RIT-PI-e]
MTGIVNLNVLSARFDVLITQHRVSEAVEMLEGQAAHHEGRALYWVLLGRALSMNRRFDDAEQAARRSVALDPQASETEITLVLALLGQRRFDEAIGLAWSVVEHHAEEPDAHYWLSHALVARQRDRQDLVVAHQAARHALSLNADGENFAQAVRTASLIDEDGEARLLLEDGLAEYPQNRDLLLLSGRIKAGAKVVGPREELLGGLLRTNPLDTSAEADLASSSLRWVRERLFLGWYHLLLFAFVAVLPLPTASTLVIALGLAGTYVLLAGRSYRRLDAVLPPGYLREQLAQPQRGRIPVLAVGIANVLVLAGSVLAAVIPGPGPGVGDALLVLAAVVLGGGLLAVEKARARLAVSDHPDDRRVQAYRLVRFGNNASSYRRYWWAALAGIMLMTVTASTTGDATGGAGMLSVGILWTIKTMDLLVLSVRTPGEENPWVTAHALTRQGGRRPALRGRLMGGRFLLLLLFVCFFTTATGASALGGGFT